MSSSWNWCSRSLGRLSEPTSAPPGRRTQHLGEQLVLQRDGGNVVKHRERAVPIERVLREGQLGGIAVDHSYVGAGQLLLESVGGLLFVLDGDEPLDAVAQPFGGGTGARADLEHRLTEIDVPVTDGRISVFMNSDVGQRLAWFRSCRAAYGPSGRCSSG